MKEVLATVTILKLDSVPMAALTLEALRTVPGREAQASSMARWLNIRLSKIATTREERLRLLSALFERDLDSSLKLRLAEALAFMDCASVNGDWTVEDAEFTEFLVNTKESLYDSQPV